MIRTSLHEVVFFLLRQQQKKPHAPTETRARGREFERQGARMRVGACPSVGLLVEGETVAF